MVDAERLSAAYETARCDLLSECEPSGHWVGHLASSALATATAVSALALVERHAPTTATGRFADELREARTSEVIVAGLRWLATHQNTDGGWGDTDRSLSNVATTMLVRAAFHLTAVPTEPACLMERADHYIAAHGDVAGLRRRFGKDKTFAAPILANCALAGLMPWRAVPALPFELACLPREVWKSLRLPVVSYAIPALVAIGQARYVHRKPFNPFVRMVRALSLKKSLHIAEQQQSANGGFLEAIPLTSFVVMSLSSIGRASHPMVHQGVEFLLASVRADGSWPIDTNLATWNTTLAVNALAAGGEDLRELGCLDWLLSCQHQESHPFTGAEPGGWSSTDQAGGAPDADNTASALLALAAWPKDDPRANCASIGQAAVDGVEWLLNLQNNDGGWPTFCRGWGTLRFDRSGSDLTAHAVRAIHAWRLEMASAAQQAGQPSAAARIAAATESGFRFLARQQQANGCWLPLWFGNQYQPDESNPIYGTARVLAAYRDCGRLETAAARRGLDYLAAAQNDDGGWGGRPTTPEAGPDAVQSSVEETGLAVEALLSAGRTSSHEDAARQGLTWLIDAVEANRHQECSPIGFYFGKLWYHERMYPLLFTVAALARGAGRQVAQPEPRRVVPLGKV